MFFNLFVCIWFGFLLSLSIFILILNFFKIIDGFLNTVLFIIFIIDITIVMINIIWDKKKMVRGILFLYFLKFLIFFKYIIITYFYLNILRN